MTDGPERAKIAPKFAIKTAVLLFVVFSAYAIAGWHYWQWSEGRPWMLGFAAFCVFYIVQICIERIAKPYFFYEKFFTLYVPILIFVSIDDLNRLEDVALNRNEYFGTVVLSGVFFAACEFFYSPVARYWNAWRENR